MALSLLSALFRIWWKAKELSSCKWPKDLLFNLELLSDVDPLAGRVELIEISVGSHSEPTSII